MSDTPRTDGCVWRHPLRPDEECVDASVARTFERELGVANKALEISRAVEADAIIASLETTRPEALRKDEPSKEQASVRDKIMAERAKGNIVFWGLPDELMAANLEKFVEQPADGILYDLNRLEEVCMTFITDKKWVNDFAVATVIRKLVEQRDSARSPLACRQDFPQHAEVKIVFTKDAMYVDTGDQVPGMGNIAYKVNDEQAKSIMDALRARNEDQVKP